jgi:UDP-GlcNAc:undecaprenyl-phosphate/decaprenyl-phosphate GlcNAc-1-phosphate transferase
MVDSRDQFGGRAVTIPYLVAGAALISFVLCALLRHVPLLDSPDGGRKQQKAPVPRTGGIGILGAILITLGAFALLAEPSSLEGMAGGRFLFALALVITPWVIGFLDDWLGLSALLKLALLCGWAVFAAVPFFMSGGAGGLLLGLAVTAWLVVITNAVNFMDGANGLAMGSVAIMHVGLFPLYAVLMMCFGNCVRDPVGEFALVAQLALFGAVLGFLVWNMRGGLYAGDCGSLGAGGLFGLMAVYHLGAGMDGVRAALVVLTLSLPFLIDVLWTLAWRSLKGRNLLQAHTDHAYQRLIARGWGHASAAAFWWGMTLVCAVLAVVTMFGAAESSVQVDAFPVLQLVTLAVLAVIGSGLWWLERSRAQ